MPERTILSGFALRLLNHAKKKKGKRWYFRFIEELEKRRISIPSDTQIDNPTYNFNHFLVILNRVKEELKLSPDDLKKLGRKEGTKRASLLAGSPVKIYEDFCRKVNERNYFNFGRAEADFKGKNAALIKIEDFPPGSEELLKDFLAGFLKGLLMAEGKALSRVIGYDVRSEVLRASGGSFVFKVTWKVWHNS